MESILSATRDLPHRPSIRRRWSPGRAIPPIAAAILQACGGVEASTTTPVVIAPRAPAHFVDDSGNEWSSFRLHDGTVLEMAGEYRAHDTWSGAARFVYRVEGEGAICVVDPGRAERREVARSKSWISGGPMRQRGKGASIDVWLSTHATLCAIDVANGTRRVLLRLPNHLVSLSRSHVDPDPIWNGPGTVLDSRDETRWFALYEESNAEVAPWQRRDDRFGGTFLARLHPETGEWTREWGSRYIPRRAFSWELSLERREFYAVVATSDRYDEYELEAWSLDGERRRVIDAKTMRPGKLALSPDGRWLLVERQVWPESEERFATFSWSERSTDRHRQYVDERFGGFALVDLRTGEVVLGPNRGHDAVWAPDSASVYFIDDRSIARFRVAEGSTSLVGRLRPSEDAEPPQAWPLLVLSADGRCLAWNVGDDRESIVLVDFATSFVSEVVEAASYGMACFVSDSRSR